MIEEYYKYEYSILLKVSLRCHFSFLISHTSYELTEKDFFNELTN